MNGFIVVNSDNKLNFDFGVGEDYIIKKDKKIYYREDLIDLETMSMVFESSNNEAVNYITKNVKVCSWLKGNIDNYEEIKTKYSLNTFILAEAFIESSSNKLTLKNNVKNFYKQLTGKYNAIIANLTYNTRSSIIFLSHDDSPLQLYVAIKDNSVILGWHNYGPDYSIEFKKLGYDIYFVTSLHSYFVLQPLYLINKFKERKNKYSLSIALSYLYKYLKG